MTGLASSLSHIWRARASASGAGRRRDVELDRPADPDAAGFGEAERARARAPRPVPADRAGRRAASPGRGLGSSSVLWLLAAVAPAGAPLVVDGGQLGQRLPSASRSSSTGTGSGRSISPSTVARDEPEGHVERARAETENTQARGFRRAGWRGAPRARTVPWRSGARSAGTWGTSRCSPSARASSSIRTTSPWCCRSR